MQGVRYKVNETALQRKRLTVYSTNGKPREGESEFAFHRAGAAACIGSPCEPQCLRGKVQESNKDASTEAS